MNRNIIQVALGFGAGYFTSSFMNERLRNPPSKTTDLSRVIKKSKDMYDAASEHPERLPEAVDKARKVVVHGNSD